MDSVTTFKQRRLAAGMTQFDLAVASGVSTATIHRIEAGRTNPKEQVIEALDRVLKENGSDCPSSAKTRCVQTVPGGGE